MRQAPRRRPVLHGAAPLSGEGDHRLLRRLEGQLHRGFARSRERVDIGGGAFRLHIWPACEPFYRNRALPVAEPPAGWSGAVAELVAAFAEVGREPRLEFFAELWPGLPDALERAGFALDTAAPALAMTPRDEARPLPPGVLILDAVTASDLERAFLEEIQAAFGVPPPLDEAELARFRGDLAEGATMAAARIEGGRPVAGACLIGIDGGEAEMAGVWSGTSHRRRGHATAACAGLAAAFFGKGGRLVWLSAADDEIEPLYHRLGFVRAGTQLNYALTGARTASSA